MAPGSVPGAGEETQEFTGGKRGSGDLASTLRLTLPLLGPGLGSRSPGLGAWTTTGGSPRVGEGRQERVGVFPSGFKVADGGLHGPEWAGSTGDGGRGDRREKGSLGLQSLEPSRAAGGRAGVRGPAPDGCPWRLEGCGRAPLPRPPECPFLPRGAPGEASETPGLSSSGAPHPRALCSSQHRVFPQGALGPVPVGPASGEPQRVRSSTSFSPNRVPPPPRRRGVTYQTPPPRSPRT